MKRTLLIAIVTSLLTVLSNAQIRRDEGLSPKERQAPQSVQAALLKARENIRNRDLGFRVGLTGVAGLDMKNLAGTLTPPNINQLAAEQNKEAAKILNISRTDF